MYRHCPSCTRDLGTNEALEQFPVGRRLAYDLGRGRLWVLCPACRAWNLAPLEERWEALEEAERAFETASLGAATEHIALGRMSEGTELVRIGRAEGPELAGWRYAGRIDARWRRAQWIGGVGTVAWFSGIWGMIGLPVLLTGAAGLGAWSWARGRATRFEVPDREGESPRPIRRGQLRHLHLLPGTSDTDSGGSPDEESLPWEVEVRPPGQRAIRIPPELRNRALRFALLDLNREVGKPQHVRKAMERVVAAGDPGRLAGLAARDLVGDRPWEVHLDWPFGDLSALRRADPVLRLAVEIAANEEVERLALEGELYRLETEWRDAEELARISDALLTPDWVRRRIEGWRGGKG